MNDGILLTEGARPTVRFERVLAHPPTVVWRAMTDRDELNQWFPTDVVLDRWEVGASITFPFRNDEGPTLYGEVLEVDEPRRLSFTWGDELLGIELTPVEGGTRFVFTDELPSGIAARNAAGWEVCLARLLPASEPTERDLDWKPRFAAYVAAFEPRLGPQEGPPQEA